MNLLNWLNVNQNTENIGARRLHTILEKLLGGSIL